MPSLEAEHGVGWGLHGGEVVLPPPNLLPPSRIDRQKIGLLLPNHFRGVLGKTTTALATDTQRQESEDGTHASM
jgi:hypothetical protein